MPREIPASEAAAAWVGGPPPDDVSSAGGSGQRRPPRQRRDLLVSDAECSLENLCDPAAWPRVCYYNVDICDGERDCSSGRDELYCDECLCPYRRVDGASADVPSSAVRFWNGVNLKACARACNDIETGCIGFSFNPLKTDEHRCRLYFQQGTIVVNVGGHLYIRSEPSVPRLGRGPVQSVQPVSASVDCSSLGMFQCGSGQCLPFSQLCDGLRQCSGSSEERTCSLYPSIYSRLED